MTLILNSYYMKTVFENKYSMYIRVKDFLAVTSNWTAISVILIMTNQRLALNNLLLQMGSILGVTLSDNTGYAEDKATTRKSLETSTFLVSSGLAGLYLSQGKKTLKNKFDYTASDLYNFRDTELPTIAEEVYLKADTERVALADFGVSTTAIDNLNIIRNDYLAQLSAPQLARGDKKAANKELVNLEAATDKVLADMDVYVKPLAVTNSLIYNAYRAARLIDDNAATHSGGTSPDLEGNLPVLVATLITLPNTLNVATANFDIEIVGGQQVQATFNNGTNPLPPGVNPKVIAGSSNVSLSSLELNYDALTRKDLYLFNSGTSACSYKIWIK